jgi:hypothetical protein
MRPRRRRVARPPNRPDRVRAERSPRGIPRAAVWVLALAAISGLSLPVRAQSPYRPPPSYLQFGKPDQEQGRQILQQFREQGIRGDYYLEFELRVMPRRGDERVLRGALWGSRTAAGPITRVSIRPGAVGAPELRLLVQGGPAPALWRWHGETGAAAERLGVGDLFTPVAGTDLTPFDLQMPFLYWPDFVYEGLARVAGRPAHQFLLYPPADVTAQHPELTGVRVYLDTQYVALVEAELIGAGGKALKAVNLLDLKKVGDQWLVKSVDLRDETTREKTRFTVTAAALNQHFAPAVFTAAGLSEPAPVPAGLDRLSDR